MVGTYGPYLYGDCTQRLEGDPPSDIYDALESVKPHTIDLLKKLTNRTTEPKFVRAHYFLSFDKYLIGLDAGFTRDDQDLDKLNLTQEYDGLVFKVERGVRDISTDAVVYQHGIVIAAKESFLVEMAARLWSEGFYHNSAYSWVQVEGRDFYLTPKQSDVIQFLHRERLYGNAWVNQDRVLVEVDAGDTVDSARRLFTRENKDAYAALIETDARGNFRLKYF